MTKRSSNKQRSNPVSGSGTVKLTSHRDVFNEGVISSNRTILEGDPGYGKSCFTLQAAHDWCTTNILSPLKDVDIFILLPLRLLGGISSLYLAIKLLLMPGESKLTEDDIMTILDNSSSVVIVLDGYDEYPDKDNDNDTDVIKLTKGTMFANFKVITCTRSSCLPKDLDPRTVFIRLTGFDDTARDDYIRRAVVGDNNAEAANTIKHLLSNSPVMGDICQVPLFCVMFAHIAHDEKDLVKFTSVTSFFNYMLTCFYNHLWRKPGNQNSKKTPADHSTLNKVAFDDLTSSSQQIVWDKDVFKKRIGKECYNELIAIGILLEEEVMEVNDKPGVSVSEHIRRREIVRFYHKLFAEWYAANYLASYAGGMFALWLDNIFARVNPLDLQFVFRFACGLNKKASGRIINYLRGIEDGQSFASLCFFEQSEKQDDIIEIVKPMCSVGMVIRSTDSRLLQRSTIQVLDVASKSQIPVSSLHLINCFHKIDGNQMIFNSGLALPCPLSVTEIRITTLDTHFDYAYEEEENMTEKTVMEIFQFGLQSRSLQELNFEGYLMPLCFSSTSIPHLKSRHVEVSWNLQDFKFHLDPQSGKWKIDDVDAIRHVCSRTVVLYNIDSNQRQSFIILMLENAGYHNISVKCLHLMQSFNTTDGNTAILQSGLALSCPLSVTTIQITTDEREDKQTLNEVEVSRIFKYALKSQALKFLIFEGNLLPLAFDATTIPEELKSRRVKVSWSFCKRDCFLELESGQWKHHNVKSIQDLCSITVTIKKTHSRLRQNSAIQLLVVASNHDIPISCIHLMESFNKIDGNSILLHSGISVPKVMVTTIKITKQITNVTSDEPIDDDISEAEMNRILQYGLQSKTFRKLSFHACLLPHYFIPSSEELQSGARNVKVLWCPCDDTFYLDVKSGKWKVRGQDFTFLRDLCSRGVFIEKNDNKLKQRSTLQLLVIASDKKISISRLCLRESCIKFNAEGITLISGLHLPQLSTIQTMEITAEGREMADTEIGEILTYANQSRILSELKFFSCLLPLNVPANDIREALRSKQVTVYWYPSNYLGHFYQLHLHSGQWLKGGYDELTETQYYNEVEHFRKQWSYTDYQNKREHTAGVSLDDSNETD